MFDERQVVTLKNKQETSSLLNEIVSMLPPRQDGPYACGFVDAPELEISASEETPLLFRQRLTIIPSYSETSKKINNPVFLDQTEVLQLTDIAEHKIKLLTPSQPFFENLTMSLVFGFIYNEETRWFGGDLTLNIAFLALCCLVLYPLFYKTYTAIFVCENCNRVQPSLADLLKQGMILFVALVFSLIPQLFGHLKVTHDKALLQKILAGLTAGSTAIITSNIIDLLRQELHRFNESISASLTALFTPRRLFENIRHYLVSGSLQTLLLTILLSLDEFMRKSGIRIALIGASNAGVIMTIMNSPLLLKAAYRLCCCVGNSVSTCNQCGFRRAKALAKQALTATQQACAYCCQNIFTCFCSTIDCDEKQLLLEHGVVPDAITPVRTENMVETKQPRRLT